jgi:hypothetical protein
MLVAVHVHVPMVVHERIVDVLTVVTRAKSSTTTPANRKRRAGTPLGASL